MATKMTSIQNNEVIKQKAQTWLKSLDGQQTIQDALQKTKTITTHLQKERRVDVKSLHESFTV